MAVQPNLNNLQFFAWTNYHQSCEMLTKALKIVRGPVPDTKECERPGCLHRLMPFEAHLLLWTLAGDSCWITENLHERIYHP